MSVLPAPAAAGFFAGHSAAELAVELRAGRVSPTELAEFALTEADRLQPSLNSFVTIDEDGARAAARRATQELASGGDRGPLHGIPVAVKDLVDTAGLRTTMGSRHFADHVPDRDATCVHRLRAAGAVIIGKTATHEFAYGPTGDRAATGPARNPYRPDHMTGGSSGGSAAAVAAGIVPVSVGTDTGGSVRIPAALCGIVGLKPTLGAVPTDGVFPLASSTDTVGPMARTAEDARLLWNVLAGRQDTLAPVTPRVAWIPPDFLYPTAPEVAELSRKLLSDNGLALAERTVAEFAELGAAYAVIQGCEAYAVHAERLATAPELYDQEVAERLGAAGAIRGWEYVRAVETRDRARRVISALFDEVDLLALPTTPIAAPPLERRSMALGETAIDVRQALLAMTRPWSVAGLPAISVPAGLVDGLPAGLQLVAPAGGEGLLLGVAHRLLNRG